MFIIIYHHFFIFTEDQFIDMFTCVVALNSVLSVDRPFNLGTYFLTAISFKNNKVTVRNIGCNPLF